MKPSSKARRKKLVFLFLSHTILSQIYFLLVRNKLDNEGQEMRICVCLLPPPHHNFSPLTTKKCLLLDQLIEYIL